MINESDYSNFHFIFIIIIKSIILVLRIRYIWKTICIKILHFTANILSNLQYYTIKLPLNYNIRYYIYKLIHHI